MIPPGNGRSGGARREVQLRVEYPDAEAFLSDYRENICKGGTFFSSVTDHEVGDQLRITLTFPGLLEPIRLRGEVTWARIGREPGVGVEFDLDADLSGRLALERTAAAVESGDPRLIARLVHVLVVEDNTVFGEMVEEGLNRQASRVRPPPASFVCIRVSDGAGALDVLESRPIELLLVDWYLPVLGGRAIIQTCREIYGPQLPIIVMSSGDDRVREAALAAGADIFIPKPFRLATMFDAVAKLLAIDLSV